MFISTFNCIFGHLNFSLCSELHVKSTADFRFVACEVVMEEVETFEDRISNSFLFALSTATGRTSLERDHYDQGETSNERRSTLVETSCQILQKYFRGDSLIAKNTKFYSRENFQLYSSTYTYTYVLRMYVINGRDHLIIIIIHRTYKSVQTPLTGFSAHHILSIGTGTGTVTNTTEI